MRSRLLAFALLALCFASVDAHAQLQGGSISGTVKDEQGGVLPGVLVTVQGLDAALSVSTDSAGEFRFLNLAPGPYKMTVALSGFTTLVRENVIVAVGRTVNLPMSLRIAAVAETITVSAESPVVDARAVTGTAVNFSADELEKIPTSRDPTALLRAAPGVLIDRVNVAGNETGQAGNFVSKATRSQDQVWTMDGINITDMASTSTPTYYNFDNFEEIQVSTSGQDIKQPTGGLGINLIIKRGTNEYRGNLRGYFSNENLESDNTPDELAAVGVRHKCNGAVGCIESDHNKQITDYGFEIGGPIARDRAWFFGSYAVQQIDLVRRAGALIDKTTLADPNLKVNWMASSRDLVSFLYFNGFKLKDGRSPNTPGITKDAPTATFHQDNAYSDNPLHGLFKIADDRTFGSRTFVSAKLAYYNTGFVLDPMGGLDMQAGRSLVTSQSYGSTSQSINIRPQKTINVDASSLASAMGVSHDLKYGFGYRRVDAFTGTRWPGNMILALEQSATDLRAQVFRQGYGGNQANYLDFYVGDTIARGRATIDLGLRYDRQWGRALPSETLPNAAFPTVVPGISFAGYEAPFTWSTFSPRAGFAYALDESRRTVVRATFSRFAGQLPTGIIGTENPTSVAGSVTYRWTDLNADHFAQANEVDLTRQVGSPGGGFDPANPTAVTSSSRVDPGLKSPRTSSFVLGLERELLPALAVRVAYNYNRTSQLYGNLGSSITPRRAVTLADYTAGSGFTGTLPDGTPYSVATYIPSPARIAAGPAGFLTTTIPDFYTDYNGIELGITKRLTNRWMAQANFAWNNAREHFPTAAGQYDTNGNPTPTLAEPLKDGGQFAPAVGNVFPNAKWNLNINGMYEAGYGFELSANVFARQGYPFPLFRPGTTAALGADSSLAVLVTPAIDYFRYPNLWNTDFRAARSFEINRFDLRLMADVFNLFNANTALIRVNNITATNFNTLTQNLSPRIARFGVVLSF